jgi:hypothetical protein
VEGLHAVGGPQLKYKYSFPYSFICYVFIYVVTSMVLSGLLHVCFYYYFCIKLCDRRTLQEYVYVQNVNV